MNELVDILEKESNAAKDSPQSSSPEKVPNGPVQPLANGVRKEPPVTLVHKNFQVTELSENTLQLSTLKELGSLSSYFSRNMCRAY